MDKKKIRNIEHLISLWQDIYTKNGRIDWSGMLPYYADDIIFRDSIQEIHGKARFTAMTERLARRSKNLRFIVHNAVMRGETVFVEWEMVISYKRLPISSIYGSSRLRLRNGKVCEQRDYYDLWGDIFDNIPVLSALYRIFMKRVFG